ncbi:hypothetical protein BH09ACT6_BH09ACT6_10480 [soil metagenome]
MNRLVRAVLSSGVAMTVATVVGAAAGGPVAREPVFGESVFGESVFGESAATVVVGAAGVPLEGTVSAGTTPADTHWPVAGEPIVLREFIAPQNRYSAGHRGIDLTAGVGSVINAVADGTVSFVGVVVDRPVVSVAHDGGFVSTVEPVIGTVAVGEAVTAGTPVGTVATGSHCELSCVHLGVRLNGDYVSPRVLIGGIRRAILLPAASG